MTRYTSDVKGLVGHKSLSVDHGRSMTLLTRHILMSAFELESGRPIMIEGCIPPVLRGMTGLALGLFCPGRRKLATMDILMTVLTLPDRTGKGEGRVPMIFRRYSVALGTRDAPMLSLKTKGRKIMVKGDLCPRLIHMTKFAPFVLDVFFHFAVVRVAMAIETSCRRKPELILSGLSRSR